MGKIILVTGGARSGKSSYAEKLAKDTIGNILYIATSIPFDEEMKLRVKKHKAQRPKEWETFEGYKDYDINLSEKLKNTNGVLLDCITNMVTNLILEKCTDVDNINKEEILEIEAYVDGEINKLIELIEMNDSKFIIVTNEVGMGLVPEYPLGRLFRDIAGRANQILAKAAEEVYFCVSGIPVRIK
jgi:adenosylcobinamide kinase/adenosylcobinamide-phosphate guanylyltransferase